MPWKLTATEGQLVSEHDGVVVLAIHESSALLWAGIKPQDVMLFWERPAGLLDKTGQAQGRIRSIFDWGWLEVDQRPRGGLILHGLRDGRPVSFVLDSGLWNAAVRPVMSEETLRIYLEGQKLVEMGEVKKGAAVWWSLAETVDGKNRSSLRCWLLLKAGQELGRAELFQDAITSLLATSDLTHDSVSSVAVYDALGDVYMQHSKFPNALRAYRSAMEIRESTWGISLGLSMSKRRMAEVYWLLDEYDLAEAFDESALAIRTELAPNPQLAGYLRDLAEDAVSRDHLDKAEDYYNRALKIVESIAPASLEVAEVLDDIGDFYLQREGSRAAEELFSRSLAIHSRLSPEGPGAGAMLNKLGYVALSRGHIAEAEEYYRRALVVCGDGSSQCRGAAFSLDGLGHVSLRRNDLDEAANFFKQALAIEEKVRPNGRLVGRLLVDLGHLAYRRDEFENAGNFYHRALLVYRQHESMGSEVAGLYESLGAVAMSQNNFESAKNYYSRSLAILQIEAPGSLGLAKVFSALGSVAGRRYELEAAAKFYKEALAIYEVEDPGGLGLAKNLDALAWVAFRQGRLSVSDYFMRRALAIFELESPGSQLLAGALSLLGSIALRRGDMTTAEEFHGQATALGVGGSVMRVGVDKIAGFSSRAGQRLEALGYGRNVLEFYERQGEGILEPDMRLWNVGSMALEEGQLEVAGMYFKRALDIQLSRNPDSSEVASTLHALGRVAFRQGDLQLAEEYWQETLSVVVKASSVGHRVARASSHPGLVLQSPKSLQIRAYRDLGLVATKRGDFGKAEEFYRHAIALGQAVDADGLGVSDGLYELGSLAMRRGELELAKDYHSKALGIRLLKLPGSRELTKSLVSISDILVRQGRLKEAKEYSERALKNCKEVVSSPLEMADDFDDLGRLAERRGDRLDAEGYYLRALRIREKLIPDSLQVGVSLSHLGSLALRYGNSDSATEYHGRALGIRERIAPQSSLVADSLESLALAEESHGDRSLSLAYQQRALFIRNKVAPFSIKNAQAHHWLAGLYRRTGNLSRSVDFYQRAVDVIEAQVGILGGSFSAQGDYLKKHMVIYRDAVEVLRKMGRYDEALYNLERFKGRVFISMLAEREMIFAADVGEQLDRARRELSVRLGRVQGRLVSLIGDSDQDEIEALSRELRGIRAEQAANLGEIRRASPKLAALYSPRLLDLRGILQALDPGTVLLSYNVRENETDLFSLRIGGGLSAKVLAIGEVELRGKIDNLRGLVFRREVDGRDGSFNSLKATGTELFNTLLGPVAGAIGESQRILVIPDGPLHLLPWSLLIRDLKEKTDSSSRTWQYLVEWKPVHTALSATVYRELKDRKPIDASERAASTLALVAFGDPAYPSFSGASSAKITDVRVRSSVERGVFGWERLLNSRREVGRIYDLFSSGRALAYFGAEATEEAFKSIASSARIIHFATHAHLDDRFPMNSALVLAIPEESSGDQDNGLLQAWEILERIRIDADLVVLSACSTALGQEQGGEGMIGLTRAFQYAGARSVVASLWNVEDESTAELMVRFYRHLKRGEPKDEALRAAQRELIQGPVSMNDSNGRSVERDFSAPFHWAAFQIYGDWR